MTFVAGCDRTSPPPPAEVSSAAPAGETAPDPGGADLAPVLAELTQQVRKFSFEQKRAPASLNELVTAGYLSAVPQAPDGKAFAIDPKTMQVVPAK